MSEFIITYANDTWTSIVPEGWSRWAVRQPGAPKGLHTPGDVLRIVPDSYAHRFEEYLASLVDMTPVIDVLSTAAVAAAGATSGNYGTVKARAERVVAMCDAARLAHDTLQFLVGARRDAERRRLQDEGEVAA